MDSLVQKRINLSVCLQFPLLFNEKIINDLYSQAKITENSGLQLFGNILYHNHSKQAIGKAWNSALVRI